MNGHRTSFSSEVEVWRWNDGDVCSQYDDFDGGKCNSSSSDAPPMLPRVLSYSEGSVESMFEVGRKLGEGQYGSTFSCTERTTGTEYAMKRISKARLVMLGVPLEDVKREIAVLHHLEGHENVVSIRGAYEDEKDVYIVMELCTGGELYERILSIGHYSEREAAKIIRTIMQVVKYCHSLEVVHRDVKPENFLFANEDDSAPLKAIDFGLSIFFRPGEPISEGLAGSMVYLAPEMVESQGECYGPEVDVWSSGVLLYILLSGHSPFPTESENPNAIFRAIVKADIDFTSSPWPAVSTEAKELLQGMLTRDPAKRLSAHDVLMHPWVNDHEVAPDHPLDPTVLLRLRQFSNLSRVKKLATRVIAELLSEEEILGLRAMFSAMDTDSSGTITLEELKEGLKKVGANVSDREVEQLLAEVDVDDDHVIDYGEFFAATLNMRRVEKEENLVSAFQYFDKDGNGIITMDELRQVCDEFHIKQQDLHDMMAEVDENDDQELDYVEFMHMMHRHGRDTSCSRTFSYGKDKRQLDKIKSATATCSQQVEEQGNIKKPSLQ